MGESVVVAMSEDCIKSLASNPVLPTIVQLDPELAKQCSPNDQPEVLVNRMLQRRQELLKEVS